MLLVLSNSWIFLALFFFYYCNTWGTSPCMEPPLSPPPPPSFFYCNTWGTSPCGEPPLPPPPPPVFIELDVYLKYDCVYAYNDCTSFTYNIIDSRSSWKSVCMYTTQWSHRMMCTIHWIAKNSWIMTGCNKVIISIINTLTRDLFGGWWSIFVTPNEPSGHDWRYCWIWVFQLKLQWRVTHIYKWWCASGTKKWSSSFLRF